MRLKAGILFLALFSFIFAYQDSDLDGVDDTRDKCPNTPFYYLVDKYGCPIKRIDLYKKEVKKKRIKYYYRIGFSHAKDSNYESNSIYTSISVFLKPFYLTFKTRYYSYTSSSSSGWGNSSIYISYRKYFKNLALFPSFSITIPTISRKIGNRYTSLTPALLIDYYKGKWDLFLYTSRVIRLGSGKEDYWVFSSGFGYLYDELYISPSIDFVESPDKGNYEIYGNLYIIYYLTQHLFLSINLSKGLNEKAIDRNISVKFGIKF